MGVSTNYSAWFGAGTASTAVLTPAQVAAVAPLVRVTAAYVVMYYAFCFFQSWSKLYLSASRRPSLFFPYVDSCSCASSTRGGGVLLPLASAAAMACRVRHREIGSATPPIRHRRDTPSTRYAIRHRRDIDATHVIDETQAADAAAERRRQEADARAAQVRRLRVVQDKDAAVVGRSDVFEYVGAGAAVFSVALGLWVVSGR
jgi:hypothetical protein